MQRLVFFQRVLLALFLGLLGSEPIAAQIRPPWGVLTVMPATNIGPDWTETVVSSPRWVRRQRSSAATYGSPQAATHGTDLQRASQRCPRLQQRPCSPLPSGCSQRERHRSQRD